MKSQALLIAALLKGQSPNRLQQVELTSEERSEKFGDAGIEQEEASGDKLMNQLGLGSYMV